MHICYMHNKYERALFSFIFENQSYKRKDRKQAKINRIQLQWFNTFSVTKINQQIGQESHHLILKASTIEHNGIYAY